MKQAPSDYRSLAQWVLAEEAEEVGSLGSIDAAERVFGKLRDSLTPLIGSDGYRAVLSRAVHLAQVKHPFLGRVAVEPEGASFSALLEGLRARLAGLDEAEVREGLVDVLGGLLSLLGAFIGEGLTRRQVRAIWPGLPDRGAGSGSEEAGR